MIYTLQKLDLENGNKIIKEVVGIKMKEVMSILGVPKSTVYKIVAGKFGYKSYSTKHLMQYRIIKSVENPKRRQYRINLIAKKQFFKDRTTLSF